MMTEIQEYTPNAPVAQIAPMNLQPTSTTVDLVAWANELSAAHTIASAICATDFVPKEFRDDPDKTATAILYGKSVGLDPLAALSSVFVVHGKPAMYSRAMVALAQRAGVEFRRAQATDQAVTVCARRKGDEDWQEFTWTIQRADRAGYMSNSKYKTDPIGMLTAKAFTEAVRVIAPDVLLGIAVAEEVELGDYDDKPAPRTPSAQAVASKKSFKRKKQAEAVPAYTPEPAPEHANESTGEIKEESPAEEVKYIGKADLARVSSLLDRLGVSDRVEKLAFVRSHTGNDSLRGANGLTEAQGKELISYLEAQPELAEG